MPRRLWTAYLTLTLVVLFSLSVTASPFGRAVIVNTASLLRPVMLSIGIFRLEAPELMSSVDSAQKVEAATILSV